MNEFSILGRLNWLNIQYYDNGTCKTIIYLAKKLPPTQVSRLPSNHKPEDEYETFTITFFNTSRDNVAERLADECKQGDYMRIKGKLSVYKLENSKPVLKLIGWNFKRVEWDAETNKYVDIESEQPQTEEQVA